VQLFVEGHPVVSWTTTSEVELSISVAHLLINQYTSTNELFTENLQHYEYCQHVLK